MKSNTMPILYCPTCGYNLTGLTESRCPECGEGFSRAELAAIGGIKHPSIVWFLVVLVLLPVVFALLVYKSFEPGTIRDLFEPFALVFVGIYFLLSLGSSIFTARNIARRLVMRPPKSRPNLGSVTLTILFATIFFLTQGFLVFVGFFVGCAANFQI